ncbi:MAG: hypothetical protein R3362_07240, partial [Rhodothermales bacterium]|nr:hypothetical protein [Rhodothermales bacterium]
MLQSTPVQRRAGSARRAYDHAPRWVRLGVRVGALVGALAVLDVLFLRATRLPAARFEEPVLVAELARRLLGLDPAALVLLGFLLGLVGAGFWHRSFGPRWEAFGLGRRFRVLALVAAGALAWAAATYGYNAYFDQLHAVDRLLLVALLPLVVWRPVFVWAFLLVLFPVLWQFHVPIGGASWAEPFLLIRVLMVLGVAYLFRALTGRLRGADVVFVLCCLVAAHYWVSGVGKVELDG